MLCGWLHVDHIPVISHYQADRIKIETRLKQNRTTGLSREKNFNPFNAKGNFSHPTHTLPKETIVAKTKELK